MAHHRVSHSVLPHAAGEQCVLLAAFLPRHCRLQCSIGCRTAPQGTALVTAQHRTAAVMWHILDNLCCKFNLQYNPVAISLPLSADVHDAVDPTSDLELKCTTQHPSPPFCSCCQQCGCKHCEIYQSCHASTMLSQSSTLSVVVMPLLACHLQAL